MSLPSAHDNRSSLVTSIKRFPLIRAPSARAALGGTPRYGESPVKDSTVWWYQSPEGLAARSRKYFRTFFSKQIVPSWEANVFWKPLIGKNLDPRIFSRQKKKKHLPIKTNAFRHDGAKSGIYSNTLKKMLPWYQTSFTKVYSKDISYPKKITYILESI